MASYSLVCLYVCWESVIGSFLLLLFLISIRSNAHKGTEANNTELSSQMIWLSIIHSGPLTHDSPPSTFPGWRCICNPMYVEIYTGTFSVHGAFESAAAGERGDQQASLHSHSQRMRLFSSIQWNLQTGLGCGAIMCFLFTFPFAIMRWLYGLPGQIENGSVAHTPWDWAASWNVVQIFPFCVLSGLAWARSYISHLFYSVIS